MREAMAALRPLRVRNPLPAPREDRPKGLNALGTLARHPELARAWNTFNGHILFASSLTPRVRELLVLRVAHLRNATYEWTQHVVLAADAGLDDADVARVADGPDAPGWTPLEAALLQATDELVRGACITDPTWASLSAALDDEQLMDVVFTVGAYEVLAMAFNSFAIQLDADLIGRK